jgi:hypothetical protein
MLDFTCTHHATDKISNTYSRPRALGLCKFFVQCISLFVVLLPSLWAATTTYETGSSQVWDRWQITRARGSDSTVSSTFDSNLGSAVLSFSANSANRSSTFQLGGFNSRTGWNNKSQKNLSLKLNSLDSFIINVRLDTELGARYIRYKNTDSNPSKRRSTIDVGLGENIANGNWQSINRNLQADLESADPGNRITAVHGLLVRGILKLDEVKLSTLSNSSNSQESEPVVADRPQTEVLIYHSQHYGKAGESTTSSAMTDANVSSPTYNKFVISDKASHGDVRIDASSGVWTYYPTVQSWSGEDKFTIRISKNGSNSLRHVVTIIQSGTIVTAQVAPVTVSASAPPPPTVSTQVDIDDPTIRQLVNDNSTKFVDAKKGSDNNNGSQSRPWKTLKYSFAQLRAGNTLLLRGGSYDERNLYLKTRGSSGKITTVRNYPGETVVIDASDSRFNSSRDNIWELFDGSTSTYRTKNANYGSKMFVGYAISNSGTDIPLVPYLDDPGAGAHGLSDLKSNVYDVSTKPRYVGPGVYTKSGRVYIRFSPVPSRSLDGPATTFSGSTNPKNFKLLLSSDNQVITVSGTYIKISGISFTGSRSGLTLNGSSRNIEITNSVFRVPATAILLRDGVSDVKIDGITVNGNFPDWVAWTDMKGTNGQSTPASYWPMRSAGVNGSFVKNIAVSNSQFNRVFDGMVISGSNIDVSNNSGVFIDDFIQLGSDSSHVYIYDNTMIGAGPSHYGRGDSASPGTIFLHDNFIDTSLRHLIGKKDPKGILAEDYSGWRSGKPISAHAQSKLKNGDPWKIYQNTIVFNGHHSSGSGISLWRGLNRTGKTHEVYNNVIVEMGGGSILRDASISDGPQLYDGNIYWQKSGADKPIFTGIADKRGKKERFFNLTDFRASSIFTQSKSQYRPGWENSGFSGNPHLDSRLRPIQGGVAASGAVRLPGSFHGKSNSFRGALPPR